MVTETKYVTCPDCGKLGYSENEAGGHCWECDDAEKDRLSAEIERRRAEIREYLKVGQAAIDALQEIADLPPGPIGCARKFTRAMSIAKVALGQ
jgi:hypothetical protein